MLEASALSKLTRFCRDQNAGGDLIRRKRDVGRTYIVQTSDHSYWVLTALLSFVAQFKPARLFSVTRIEGLTPDLETAFTSEREATSQEMAEIEWIKSRTDTTHQLQLSLRLDFSDRFMAKLAVGIGANLFGNAYCASAYAEDLRKMLWGHHLGADEQALVRGAGYWMMGSRLVSTPRSGVG
jgi:hypothetical protein